MKKTDITNTCNSYLKELDEIQAPPAVRVSTKEILTFILVAIKELSKE